MMKISRISKLFRIFSFSLALMLFSLQGQASIDKSPSLHDTPFQKERVSNALPSRLDITRRSLGLSRKQRVQFLKKMPWAEKVIIQLAFDEKISMGERWKAIISLGQLNPQHRILERAAQHKKWFMRNASILAMSRGPRERALRWSRQLLDDPALVVRTAAVRVIQKLKGKELEGVLWSKLQSKTNFRGGKSLWIRKNIVQTLGELSSPLYNERFVQLLNEKDSYIHDSAIAALERITNSRFKGETTAQKRQAWLSWWKDQASTPPNILSK